MDTLIWTAPPEMTTAATNLLIVCICAVCAVQIYRLKQTDTLQKAIWLVFFLIMLPTGLFGFFVHAVVIDPGTKQLAWVFLSIMLGLTTTSLSIVLFYEILGVRYLKKILCFSIAADIVFAIAVVFLSGKIPGIHHVFIAYTGIVLSVILVLLIVKRKVRPHFMWYILAILTAVIGGLFELCGDFTVSLIWSFDQGSVCHLAIAAAMCFFAAGCRRGEYASARLSSADTERNLII